MKSKSRSALISTLFLIIAIPPLIHFLSPEPEAKPSQGELSSRQSSDVMHSTKSEQIALERDNLNESAPLKGEKIKKKLNSPRAKKTNALGKAKKLKTPKKAKQNVEVIASAEAKDLLKRLIIDGDKSAYKKIKTLLKNGSATVAAFRELLKSEDYNSSQKLELLLGLVQATKALARSDDPEAKAALLKAQNLMNEVGLGLVKAALANPDDDSQGRKALKILRNIPPNKDFVSWLRTSFDQSKNPNYRRQTVRSIGGLGLDEGSNALFDILLQDRDARYRDTAYQTLVRSMSEKTLAELQAIIDDDQQDQATKVAAIDIVSSYLNVNARKKKLSRSDIEDAMSSRITELENALANPALPRNVHREAISALGEIGGSRARTILYGILLADSREFYTHAAALNLNNSREGRDLLRTLISNTQGSWQARFSAWEYLIGLGSGVRREAPNFTITDWTVDILNEGLPLMANVALKQQLVRRMGSRQGRDLDLALSNIALGAELQLRRECIIVLGIYHRQSPQSLRFAADLKRILQQSDAEVGRELRKRAAHAIAAIGLAKVYSDSPGLTAAHGDALTRQFLIQVGQVFRYPENRTILEEIANNDSDEKVKSLARQIISIIDRRRRR